MWWTPRQGYRLCRQWFSSRYTWITRTPLTPPFLQLLPPKYLPVHSLRIIFALKEGDFFAHGTGLNFTWPCQSWLYCLKYYPTHALNTWYSSRISTELRVCVETYRQEFSLRTVWVVGLQTIMGTYSYEARYEQNIPRLAFTQPLRIYRPMI